MLPIRSIVLALCAALAIAAPRRSGSACPDEGDCPTCFGRETPDLRDIVCNSESAFIVATSVDHEGTTWTSPRRWLDFFGTKRTEFHVQRFPFDERHWNLDGGPCRTFYAKPAYEITKGQAPRRVQTPEVAAFKMNNHCSCTGIIAEPGYAVVAFRNRTIAHSDELALQSLNSGVVVVPLPRGDFKIPSCNAKFGEDKSAIATEKLPAVFSNDEAQEECSKVTSCPKCDFLKSPEQLKDICQTSKELMVVKRILANEKLESSKAPWHVPKIEVYVDKDSSKQGAYEIRTKITSRNEKGCTKASLRLITGLTDSVDGVDAINDMQLGEQCQCDFIRHDHGYAMIQSERDFHKSDVLSDKETITMLPLGSYNLPHCPKEDDTQRADKEDVQCDQPEETCPICDTRLAERELEQSIKRGDSYVLKMRTSSHLRKSEQTGDARCGSADILGVIKGDTTKMTRAQDLTFTLPEKCECGAMAGYGRGFYVVVKKDAIDGERLENLPLNEKVFIVGHSWRMYHAVMRWKHPEMLNDAEDRSGYDSYSSYPAPSYGYAAPAYPAPSYGYAAPAYPAPSYGYSAPSYPAPSYGYSAPSYPAPSYGYSAPSYSAPSYGYSAPSYPAPSYGYSAPSYSAPSYGYSAPSYPAPSYGYSAPSYSAPSYGYSAPSYPAPSYGYSAPSYSAPSYPAPSYGYSAPSYSAPSYGYSAPSYGYSAPAYAAPAYGYSAPAYGYSAPSYGYSAPAYAAPAYGYSAPAYGYSAPSYAAPSYGYSAPSYSAPSYAAPSYSAPSYSAPSYSAPSYGYSAPSYSAPSYSAPSYSAPSYSAPSYSAPSYGYSAPSYSAPSYAAPSYSAPSYSAPSYSAPSYSAPSYSAPSYGYSAPSYSAPSYGYSAPSYSAPSYDYPAPSYSAPSYSAPSYSAPSYSAPAYSAPSYSAPAYSAPSYSAPAYAAPSYSAPAYAAPSYSAPAYAAPSYSAPSYSAPAYAAPSYSAPAYSAPSYSAPAYAAPSYSAPAYAAPAYPAPSYDYAAPAYGSY